MGGGAAVVLLCADVFYWKTSVSCSLLCTTPATHAPCVVGKCCCREQQLPLLLQVGLHATVSTPLARVTKVINAALLHYKVVKVIQLVELLKAEKSGDQLLNTKRRSVLIHPALAEFDFK